MLIVCLAAILMTPPVVEEVLIEDQIQGFWSFPARVELETQGGPLPFILELYVTWKPASGESGNQGAREYVKEFNNMLVRVVNGAETIDVGQVERVFHGFSRECRNGPWSNGLITFDHYGSQLFGESGPCVVGIELTRNMADGHWNKVRGDTVARVPFTMTNVRTKDDRFDSIKDAGEPAAFTGRWSVDFDSSDDLAIGTFTVDANQIASGTFLTTTGDYRYLAGRVDGDLMRLSTFDGAHAFLFHARMQDDGSIEGDFYSGNWWHETWTAVRDEDAKLPDAFEQTSVTNEEALGEMVFKDLDGVATRVLDLFEQTKAKARVIEIFGSWCPNCSDAGRELVSLKAHYGDDLAIVGLAFELTEDFDRSVTQVKRHHAHIGSDWPILIAGLNDKDKATKTLGFLDKVRSYPTLVFLNEHNEVQAVYSGFSGPATGEAYTEQRERFEALIDGLIED